MKLLDKISIYYLIIFFLLSLYALGIFSFGLEKVLWQFFPPVLATTLAGAIFDYFELKRWSRSLTPFITGLIIGLVAQFGASPLTLILSGVAAMLVKFLIKLDGPPAGRAGRHIFNPAASGLLVGMLFLSSYPSWWVGGGNFWIYLIWLPILLYKMGRWAPMVGFLIPLMLVSGPSILTSTSTLFFTSVMLIEPKTSPAKNKLGLIYGVVVAACYLAVGNIFQFDPFILSLLFGNLTKRIMDRYI